MSDTFSNLFEQIIHSERKAQESKNYLQYVKNKLSSMGDELAESEDEYKRLKGQVLLKVQRWKREELQLSFLTSRKDILLQQKNSLEIERDEIVSNLSEVQDNFLEAMSEFCSQVERFSCDYDLISTGCLRREATTKENVEKLSREKKVLEEELALLESKNSAVGKAQDELEEAKELLESTRAEHHGLIDTVKLVRESVMTLEREKSQVASIPVAGEEFKMLHKQLEDLQTDEIQHSCQALQTELNDLQKQLRYKVAQQHQKKRMMQSQQLQQQRKVQQEQQLQTSVLEQCTSNNLSITNYSTVPKQNDESLDEKFTSNKKCVSNFTSYASETAQSPADDISSLSTDCMMQDEFEEDLTLPDLEEDIIEGAKQQPKKPMFRSKRP